LYEQFPQYVYARRVGETSQARKVKPLISIYGGPTRPCVRQVRELKDF